jgi:hypothetical protein
VCESRLADEVDGLDRQAANLGQIAHEDIKRSVQLIFRRTADRDAGQLGFDAGAKG